MWQFIQTVTVTSVVKEGRRGSEAFPLPPLGGGLTEGSDLGVEEGWEEASSMPVRQAFRLSYQ